MCSVLPQLGALHLGSVPHIDPDQACHLVISSFPSLPGWPQLPRRTFKENMYAQFGEHFPGVVIEDDRIWVDRSQDLSDGLEQLYAAHLEDELAYGHTSPEYALGLYTYLQEVPSLTPQPTWVKGQVTGPISWGLTVLDQDRRPILYDEILCDALTKHLRLKARWQEDQLSQLSGQTILSLDEPYLASFGSAYVALGRDQAISMIDEVLYGIRGCKMVHCCGNTDWSLLLATSVDVLSLDAYNYARHLSLYPDEVAAFLDRGGTLAWGITPNTPAARDETVQSLTGKLLAAMNLLVQKGIHLDDILQASLITPACGLGSLTEELAEHILFLTTGVSQVMRERYA